jgi:hypothetical protein
MYFNRIAATKGEKDDFAIARFGKEAARCLKMLDALVRLVESAFNCFQVLVAF